MRPQVTETSLLAFFNIEESGRREAWVEVLASYMEHPDNDSRWGSRGLVGSELSETLRKRQIELFQARRIVRLANRTSAVTTQENKAYRSARYVNLMAPDEYEWFNGTPPDPIPSPAKCLIALRDISQRLASCRAAGLPDVEDATTDVLEWLRQRGNSI